MLNLEDVRNRVKTHWPTFVVGLQLQIADFCMGLYQQGYVDGEKAAVKASRSKPKPKKSWVPNKEE